MDELTKYRWKISVELGEIIVRILFIALLIQIWFGDLTWEDAWPMFYKSFTLWMLLEFITRLSNIATKQKIEFLLNNLSKTNSKVLLIAYTVIRGFKTAAMGLAIVWFFVWLIRVLIYGV